MIETWIADVTPLLREDVYQKYYRQLPVFRREKADRLSRMEDKALSVGAWSLLAKGMESLGGKEYPEFNLSHSFPYALCSVQEKEKQAARLGCDVETVKTPRLSVARRFFRVEEYDYIVNRPDPKSQAEAFFRYWVLKESFLKATRKGMGLAMDSYGIRFDGENRPELFCQPEEFPETYYFMEYPVEKADAKVAVCSTSPLFARGMNYVLFDV